MNISDKDLIIKSLKHIDVEIFNTKDISIVILDHYKKDLKRENKNTNIDSVKNRVRSTIKNNLKQFNLIEVGKSKNGSILYKKDYLNDNIDEDCYFSNNNAENNDLNLDFEDFLEDSKYDKIDKKNANILIQLLEHVDFIKKLPKENIGMACDSAIIYWMVSVIKDYSEKECFDNFNFHYHIKNLDKYLYEIVPFEELNILAELKTRKVKYSNIFDVSILQDKTKIEEELFRIIYK